MHHSFEDPSCNCRPMPLWSWNEHITKDGIKEQLRGLAEMGYGGVFIHPRPGLITPYFTSEWFSLWHFACNEAKQHGMECHIYDENCYPSGFAGGHLLDQHPELSQRVLLRLHNGNSEELKSKKLLQLLIYTKEPDGNGQFRYETKDGWKMPEKPDEHFIYAVCEGEATPWTAGKPYTDLARAETCQRFIELTHEQYRKHLGVHFGNEVKYVFTDEPSLQMEYGLNFSYEFVDAFKKHHKYDFLSKLPLFHKESEEGKSLRYDYLSSMNRLFSINYNMALSDWCEQNGLAYTGHFDEHRWPHPSSLPSSMAAQRWMQVPGIDLLGFQFDRLNDKTNAFYLLTIKEVVSVANQLNRERVLCEAFGGGGYESNPKDFKTMSDFLMVNGVDFINPHMVDFSILGSRKYDFPQDFHPRSSWSRQMKPLNDHSARLSALLQNSKQQNGVMLLHPTHSAWMHYRPESFIDNEDHSHMENALAFIKQTQTDLIQYLHDHCIGFDLGDESILEESASATKGGMIKIGPCNYHTVIIPQAMESLSSKVCDLLESFLEMGGRILQLSRTHAYSDNENGSIAPLYIDGRRSERIEKIAQAYRDQWIPVRILEGKFEHALASVLEPDIQLLGRPCLPSGVSFSTRVEKKGARLFLFANYLECEQSLIMKIPRGNLSSLNCWDGTTQATEIYTDPRDPSAGIVTIKLEPTSSTVYRLDCEKETTEATRFYLQDCKQIQQASIPLEFLRAVRTHPNVLNLEYCYLRTAEQSFDKQHASVANQKIWEHSGEAQDVWEWAVQFKNTLITRGYDKSSAYSLTYPFRIEKTSLESVRRNLKLAIERPHLYQITLNDEPLTTQNASQFLMEKDFLAIPIEKHIKEGLNHLTLSVEKHSVFSEVAPIYLLGDFHLIPDDHGFRVIEGNELSTGSWHDLGLPFYPWDVIYEFQFEMETNKGRPALQVAPFSWDGSALDYRIDGGLWQYARPGQHYFDLQEGLSKGTHKLQLRICGNMKNLFGPYHSSFLPVVNAWRSSPFSESSGKHYLFQSTGLYADPSLNVLKPE